VNPEWVDTDHVTEQWPEELEGLISELDDIQRRVIWVGLGLDRGQWGTAEPRTAAEIGEIVGLSQDRVRAILAELAEEEARRAQS
jgi:DNA-directed RNA polymerase sigma subunit (sigma70/sigma32)